MIENDIIPTSSLDLRAISNMALLAAERKFSRLVRASDESERAGLSREMSRLHGIVDALNFVMGDKSPTTNNLAALLESNMMFLGDSRESGDGITDEEIQLISDGANVSFTGASLIPNRR